MAETKDVVRKLEGIDKTIRDKFDSFTETYQALFQMNSSIFDGIEKNTTDINNNLKDLVKIRNNSGGSPSKSSDSNAEIIKAITNSTAIISASILGTKGGKVNSLKNLMNKGLEQVVSDLNTAYLSIFSKTGDKAGKIAETKGAVESSGSALGVFGDLINEFTKIPIKEAKDMSDKLGGLNIGKGLTKFLKQFQDGELAAMFDVPITDQDKDVKIANINKEYLAEIKSNGKTEKSDKLYAEFLELSKGSKKSNNISSVRRTFTEVITLLAKTSSLKDIGIQSLANINALGNINLAKPIMSFLTAFQKSGVYDYLGTSKDYSSSQAKKIDLIQKRHEASVSGNTELVNTIERQLAVLEKEPGSPADQLNSVMDGVMNTINKLLAIKNVGVSAYLRMQVLSSLNFGKLIKEFLKGFTNIKKETTDSASAALGVMNNIGALNHIGTGIYKSYYTLKGAIKLDIGTLIVKFIKSIGDNLSKYGIETTDKALSVLDKLVTVLDKFGLNIIKSYLKLKIATKIELGTVLFKFIDGLRLDKIIEKIPAPEEVDRIDKTFHTLGKVLKTFGLSMLILAGVAIIAPAAMIGSALFFGFAKALDHLKFKDVKNLQASVTAMEGIGKALILFSIGLGVLAFVVSMASPVVLLESIALVGAFVGLMYFMGKIKGDLNKGASAMLVMSASIVVLGIGLGVMSLVLETFSWDKLLMMSAVVIGMVGIAWLASQIKKDAIMGAVIIGLVGLALIPMAMGVTALMVPVSGMDWNKYGMLMAVIGGISLVSVLIGLAVAGTSGLALLGPVMIALTGFSLIPLAQGLEAIMPVIDRTTWQSLVFLGLTVIGLSLAFGVAGMFAPLAILGAGAMWAVSKALDVLSPALIGITGAIDKIFPPGQGLGGTIESLMKGFKLAIVIGGLSIMFAAAGTASPLILAGAWAISSMGSALVTLTEGLTIANKFDWEKFPLDRVTTVLTNLAGAFAAVVMGGGSAVGVISGIASIMSLGITDNAVEKGIKSVLGAGRALMDVAFGLKAFDTFTTGMGPGAWDIDDKGNPKVGSLPHKISTILGVVNKAFGDIGASGNTGMSYMKLFFGNDFKKSDVQVGINSVMDSGRALKSVAEGLKQFDDYTKVLDLSSNGIDSKSGLPIPKHGSLPHKIATVLGVVNKVFGDIGAQKSGNAGTGISIMSLVFGGDFGGNNVEKGISAVMDSGRALKSVAEGLKQFQDYTGQLDLRANDKGEPMPGTLPYKIGTVLGVIRKVFSDIGKGKSSNAGTGVSYMSLIFGADFGDTDVKKGIDAVKDVGYVFQSIAWGVKEWANLDKAGFKVEQIQPNIRRVLTLIGEEFSKLGAGGGFLTSPDVKSGIDAVKGVGEELKRIAWAVMEWQKIGKDKSIDFPTISKTIGTVLGMISNEFAKLGSGKGFFKDSDVESGIKSVTNVGNVLKNIADGLKPYIDLTKPDPKTGNTPIDINKLKDNIWNLMWIPINTLTAIGKADEDSLEQGADNMKIGIDVMRSLYEADSKVIGLTKGNDQAIPTLNGLVDNFDRFMKLPVNNQLTEQQMGTMNTFVRFMERWAWIQSPFEKFSKTFHNVVLDIGALVKNINTMDLAKFKEFDWLQQLNIQLIKSDANNLATKVKQIQDMWMNIKNMAQQPMMPLNNGSPENQQPLNSGTPTPAIANGPVVTNSSNIFSKSIENAGKGTNESNSTTGDKQDEMIALLQKIVNKIK